MPAKRAVKSKYKRILLKLSGEAFNADHKRLSVDPDALVQIAHRVKNVLNMDVEIGMVIGGGNIFRGQSGQARGIDRTLGDYMGMMATVINALALQDALEKVGVETRVQTAITMRRVAEPFILRRALRHMKKRRVVIFAAGTGNPFFSTDTAAALRASETGADVLLKGTKVDGIYSDDPEQNPNAKRFKKLTYQVALTRRLNVMDAAAFSLCMENHIPIIVFNFFTPGTLEGIVAGKQIGTLVQD